MKVAIISTATTGGAGAAAYKLHLGLLKQGVVTPYFIQQQPVTELMATSEVYKVEEPDSFCYRLKRKLRLTPEYRNRVKVADYAQDYEIVTFPDTSYRIEEHPLVKEADIVHLHWMADFLNYKTFFTKIKQPIVWTLHDMNPFMGVFHYEGDSERNKNLLGSLDKEILEQKKKAIYQKDNIYIACPSEWIKQKSQQHGVLNRYPHYVIPNGIDFAHYPVLDSEQAKKKLNVDNGLKTLLFVAHGLNIYRKGFDILIAAMKKLNRTDFNLISVGGDKIRVDKSINHIHIQRIDDVMELNEVYSASDITIVPSREDVVNMVMAESLANGTPVVSFSNGGMSQYIKTGANGILIDKTDADLLGDCITDFLNNKFNFDKEAVRKSAIESFDNSIQTKLYTDLYQEILNK